MQQVVCGMDSIPLIAKEGFGRERRVIANRECAFFEEANDKYTKKRGHSDGVSRKLKDM